MQNPPFLVLAAGASRRMGHCKLSLPWRDKGKQRTDYLITPTLRLTVALSQGRALVVVRPDATPELLAEIRRFGLSMVVADKAHEGQAESLKAGLRAVQQRWPDASGVLMLLGDQPLLSQKVVAGVLEAFAAQPAQAVAPICDGRRGHPVILPRAAFAPALALCGDTGGRELLESFGLRLVSTDDKSVYQDIDTLEEYNDMCHRQECLHSRPLPWLASVPWLEQAVAFSTEEPRLPVPDEAACLDILHRHGILPHILEHCRKVANFAVALAERAVDVRGILSTENPGGVAEDLVRSTLAGGLLHDVAKTWCIANGGSHAQMGAAWTVAETGNFRIAQAVMHHVEWPWALPDDVCSPTFFVSYADRRVMHDRYVTVPERYADLLVRYGLTPASRESIEGSHAQAMKLECALSAQLEIPLDACTLAGRRLVPGA